MVEGTIQLLTALASLIAVLVGLGTLVFQYISFNKQRKPVIRVQRKRFTQLLLPNYIEEWESSKLIGSVYSNSHINLVNYGGSASHIEEYSYKFLNKEKLKKEFDAVREGQETLILENGEDKNEFVIVIEGIFSFRQNFYENVVEKGSMININEEIAIPLPSFFMLLSNYLISTDANVSFPELKLSVKYSDLDSNLREQEYEIKWDNSKTVKGTVNGVILTGSLSAKLIRDKNKNDARA